jgi:hypothetical protein
VQPSKRAFSGSLFSTSEYIFYLQLTFYVQLCSGLGYLHQLVNAQSYEERHYLLNLNLGFSDDMLADGLLEANDENTELGKLLGYDKAKIEDICQSMGYDDDDDPGPTEAWFWANQNETCETFVFAYDHHVLREKAYVMWDHARLVCLNILDKAWEPPHEQLTMEELMSQYNAMMRSFDERADI